MIQPREKSTTLTNQPVISRLPVRSALTTAGATSDEPGHGERVEPHVAGQGDRTDQRGTERDRSEQPRPAGLSPSTRRPARSTTTEKR